MALIKYGGGIVQMSGSIAGTTHARNRFGNYGRARTKPVDPRSERQMAARSLIQMLCEYWRGSEMDDAKRVAWETYANSVSWYNKLGEAVQLTGFNHFIRSNAARMAVGGDVIAAGPAVLGLPASDPTFATSGSEASGKITVTFDDDLDWCDEDGGFFVLEMGQPKSPTRNFFNGPWRLGGAIAGDSVTPPTSTVDIDAPFTLTAGQKVWCRAAIIRADGRMSTRFSAAPFLSGA